MLLSVLLAMTGVAAQGQTQTLAVELGIDLENPDFQRLFSASFEVGLQAGAPATNPRETVLLSVVAQMYQEDLDGAIEFVLAEIRREAQRVNREQRYQWSPEMDYVYSANVEFALAQLYQLRNNRVLAERYYLQAIEKYPNYSDAYVRLMEIYLTQNDCEKALLAGRQAMEMGGVNAAVLRGFGLCHFQDADYGAALTSFRAASAFVPDDDSGAYYHAVAALNAGYYSESIAVLNELIRQNPGRASFYFILVNAYLENGDVDGALSTLEIVRRAGMMTTAAYALQGNIYINMDMPEAAAASYTSALTEEAGADFASFVIQFNNLLRFDEWSLLNDLLAVAVTAFSGRIGDSERRSIDVMQAQVLLGLGERIEGAQLLRDVLQDDPTNPQALLSLARYYRGEQDYERALLEYERAAQEDEVALTALMESAQLATDREQWNRALDLLLAARELATPSSRPLIERNLRALERVEELYLP